MKDASASTRPDETQSNSSPGLSDRLSVWHLWLRSQESATRSRWNPWSGAVPAAPSRGRESAMFPNDNEVLFQWQLR